MTRIAVAASILIASMAAIAPPAAVAQERVAVDHVPVAVRSLDAAEETYRALGFTLKPGRVHGNGLRNAFAKFADGSYLELISPERGAVDELSGEYAAFLARREGGAALAFRADSLPRLARRMRAAGHRATLDEYAAFSTLGGLEGALDWMFFIEYHAPVNDAPELLRHANTALGIETVWISEEVEGSLRGLHLPLAPGQVQTAACTALEGAPVVGVTVRVRDIGAARAALAGTGMDAEVTTDARGRGILIPAERAHGIWIELLERGAGSSTGHSPVRPTSSSPLR